MNIAAAAQLGQTVSVDPHQGLRSDNTPMWGTASLVEVGDTLAHHRVMLVVPDARAREAYGVLGREDDTVLGGLVRERSGWSVVAYTDRQHLINNKGPVYYLPRTYTNRSAAVRALLRWWNLVDLTLRDEGDAAARDLDPFHLRLDQASRLAA